MPCIVSPLTDDLDIMEALIESNKQRSKTPEIIGREFAKLTWVKGEQKKKGQQGKRTDLEIPTSVVQTTEVTKINLQKMNPPDRSRCCLISSIYFWLADEKP